MLKKLIILVVVLLVIGAGALYYAASNAGNLITKYKPELEKIASDTIGTKIALGKIDVSIFPTTGLKVNEFQLGGDQGLKLNDLNLKLSLAELLTGSLSVLELSLDQPQIQLKKTAQGIEIIGLALPKSEAPAAIKSNQQKAANPAASVPLPIKSPG